MLMILGGGALHQGTHFKQGTRALFAMLMASCFMAFAAAAPLVPASNIGGFMAQIQAASTAVELREATLSGFRELMDANTALMRRVGELEDAQVAWQQSSLSHAGLNSRKLQGALQQWDGWNDASCDAALNPGSSGEEPPYLRALVAVCCDGDPGENTSALCHSGQNSRGGCNKGCAAIFSPAYTHCMGESHPHRQLSWNGQNWKARLDRISSQCPAIEELGQCNAKQLMDWVQALQEVCCGDPTVCAQGYPASCDTACTTIFWPTYVRCVQPFLNVDGSAKPGGNAMAAAFRSAVGSVDPTTWLSLTNKCHYAESPSSPAPPPPVQFVNAKIFTFKAGLDDENGDRRRAQGAQAAHESIFNGKSREIAKLAENVPNCTESRQGYFLAATIDSVDTMLFCAHSHGGWAWEGFAGLGGFFGGSWRALSESMRSKSPGTFFAKLDGPTEKVEDTVTVYSGQQAFIKGESSSLPNELGCTYTSKGAFLVQQKGKLQLSHVSISHRTSFEPAGIQAQAGASVDILACRFNDLHTQGSAPNNAVVSISGGVSGSDSSLHGGLIRLEGTTFIACGPIAISSGSSMFISGAYFASNGVATPAAASLALHNATSTLRNSQFLNNVGNSILLDGTRLILSNVSFGTQTAEQGKAIQAEGRQQDRGSEIDATNVRIDRYSEISLDQYSSGTFTTCMVENPQYQAMRQDCSFNAQAPSKISCTTSAIPIKFGGDGASVTVTNQVHRQLHLTRDAAAAKSGVSVSVFKTEFLGTVTVEEGYTLNITADDPLCRDDPVGKLQRFSKRTNDPTDHAPYCQTLLQGSVHDAAKGTIISAISTNVNVQSELLLPNGKMNCSVTMGRVQQLFNSQPFFNDIIDFDHLCPGPNCFKTEGSPADPTRLEQICRHTCGRCNGFSAEAAPAAADLQPRLLVDAVFVVEQNAKLLLNNVAIRDGLCRGCEESGDCTGTCDDSYKTPAVMLESSAQLQAGFTQIADYAKPEWGWLVTSCKFRQHQTSDQSSATFEADVCEQSQYALVERQTTQSGVIRDQTGFGAAKSWHRECDFTLQVDPEESISMVFHHTPDPSDSTVASTHGVNVFCGCRDISSSDPACEVPTTIQWESDSDASTHNYTCDNSVAVIQRASLFDASSGTRKTDWTMHWQVEWEVDYACESIPPRAAALAPIMGPARIKKNGVKFVAVDFCRYSPCSLTFHRPLRVQPDYRVIVYGLSAPNSASHELDPSRMTTIYGRFVVADNATLTTENVIIDSRPLPTDTSGINLCNDEPCPAFNVSLKGSVTVNNCGIQSAPSIALPSGGFAMTRTRLGTKRLDATGQDSKSEDPVEWTSQDINFIYNSAASISDTCMSNGQTGPCDYHLQIFEDVSLMDPVTGQCRPSCPDCTVHVVNRQQVTMSGPQQRDVDGPRTRVQGLIHVAKGGQMTIRYLRLHAPHMIDTWSETSALIQVEAAGTVSLKRIQHAVVGHLCESVSSNNPACWEWVFKDFSDRGRAPDKSNLKPSDSTLTIVGPASVWRDTSVLRLFTSQQNPYPSTFEFDGGTGSLAVLKTTGASPVNFIDDARVREYPELATRITLSTSFVLGHNRSAIFIGDGSSINNDMPNIPGLLEYQIPGAYFVIQLYDACDGDTRGTCNVQSPENRESTAGIIRRDHNSALHIHVYRGQNLRLVTTTQTTVAFVSGATLTIDEGGSMFTSLVGMPSILSDGDGFTNSLQIDGVLETDACFMTPFTGGTARISGDWVGNTGQIICHDLPQMMGSQGSVHCNGGKCWTQPIAQGANGHCGNHIVEVVDETVRPQWQGQEECDLGSGPEFPNLRNSNSNDPDAACRVNCERKRCGDGIVDVDEECDDGDIRKLCPIDGEFDPPTGSQHWASCTEQWQTPDVCEDQAVCDGQPAGCQTCAQRIVNFGCTQQVASLCRGSCKSQIPSLCRPLNSNRTDSCRPNCKRPTCGDGVVDTGEACDPGVPFPVCSAQCELCIAHRDNIDDLTQYLENGPVNHCLSQQPCQNGGTCIDATVDLSIDDQYFCQCTDGYFGSVCDKIDPSCTSDPCSQNSTCIECSQNVYSGNTVTSNPNCPEGFICTAARPDGGCASAPCQNGATCIPSVDSNSFTCVCTADYYGHSCESTENDCHLEDVSLNPCTDPSASNCVDCARFRTGVAEGKPALIPNANCPNGYTCSPTSETVWYNMSLCSALSSQQSLTIGVGKTVGIRSAKAEGAEQLAYPMQVSVVGQLALTKLVISNSNRNNGDGGAVAVRSAIIRSVTIISCVFDHNTASGNGGAIAIVTTGRVDISSSAMNNNQAALNGGAIFLSGDGSLRLDAVTFQSNHAGTNGGAIHVADLSSGGSAAMIGPHFMAQACQFQENTADGHGTAVYTSDTRFGNSDCGDSCLHDDQSMPSSLRIPAVVH
jgi:predicted outer membrane repeat protein